MKIISFFFVGLLTFLNPVYGAEKSVPSTATQYIFETLIKSTGDQKRPKAPKTIDAKNIQCAVGSGRPHQFRCTATFNIDNKEIEKSIAGDNNKFFEYLDAKSAIALKEIKIGSTEYESASIKCSYSLDDGTYYKCSSDLTVNF